MPEFIAVTIDSGSRDGGASYVSRGKYALILSKIVPLLSPFSVSGRVQTYCKVKTCCMEYNRNFFLFRGVGWDWVYLVRRPLIGLLYQPRMINEHEAFGGMRIGKESRSTRRKPAPVPLCPPKIPRDFTSDRTRTAAAGSRRLTVWALTRPSIIVTVRNTYYYLSFILQRFQ
jgi:hypothetical protein